MGNLTQLRGFSYLIPIWRDVCRCIILSLALIILILSLAHPQYKTKRHIPILRNIDLVILVDTSPSMRAQDVKPSRLLMAREVIGNFITKKTLIDRVGLVVFSESSLILSYLTSDPGNILFYLDWLSGDTEPILGTSIGAGIKAGIRVFKRDKEAQGMEGDNNPIRSTRYRSGGEGVEDANNKPIFLLVSDGEDHGGELEEAIKEAARLGIPIYTIGIGSKKKVPIPIAGKYGEVKYLTISGQVVTTRFVDNTLRKIANLTGGNFYGSLTGTQLQSAMSDILETERQVIGYKLSIEYRDVYRQFLAIALGIFFVTFFI